MAPEASWQASNAETLGGSDFSLSGTHRDQRTVEGLLRRLVERVEESERRYGEALDELHARLDRLSQTAEPAPETDSSEETETLERLRSQLSSLAQRLDHPEETESGFDDLAKLGRAWSEARDMSAGLAKEQGLFASPLLQAPTPFVPTAPAFSFAMPGETPSYATPSFELPRFGTEHLNVDKRLIDIAQRLEHSIGEAMPGAAIETLNARMEEIAKRFEAALEHSPKLENLQHLERQITEIGQQLGGVERQVARIAVIEGQLHRLIERLEDGPAQMEQAASKAANEAVRLVSDTGLDKPSAAERLDTIHRDIVAMNERSRATDDRLVDTLAAMHESLRDLVHQVERGRQPLPTPPLALPQPRSELAPSPAETRIDKAATRDGGEDLRSRHPSLRSLLSTTAPDSKELEPAPAFGRAKRGPLVEEAVDLDESEPSRSVDLSFPEAFLAPRDDLVAAARRAAQSAAARAGERGALRPRRSRVTNETSTEASMELPERRKRSILMIVAVLLLLVSAALLYSRLPSKPEVKTVPPATEQSAPAAATKAIPAPAAEASPEIQAAPATERAAPPAVEAAPDTATEAAPAPDLSPVPDAAPAPAAEPEAHHATTPSDDTPNKALVARAQVLLDKLGYQIGAADGEAGARTREAIKAFELRNGMNETGEVTVPLVTKLEWLAG
jgi:localization factor PodJL